MTVRMTSSMIASFRSWCLMASACCVETTTASTRMGRPPSYSTVTWDLPSGRRKSRSPLRRASERRRTSAWARVSGSGMYSAVSRTANPNIIPWSPAPPESTPCAMSPDWGSIDEMTAHVS